LHKGQFRKHEPFELVAKHCELISLSWPFAYEQWKNEIPSENARDWEDVQTILKSPYFATFYSMTLDDQMEEINKKLADMEREKKEEEHIKVENARRAKEIRLKEEV